MITCSDSRIHLSLITNTEPGEIFLVRNAGNMAAVEFAVKALSVKYAIVCGHSSCGAMSSLLDRSTLAELPMVASWLRYAEPVLERLAGSKPTVEDAAKANVALQLENLQTLSCVRTAVDAGELELLGWYYNIRTGRIEQLDADAGKCAALFNNDSPFA